MGVPPKQAAGDHLALATLCGALLVSVPAQAASTGDDAMWGVVADGLFESPASDADGPAGRLALRLCAFALDRHPELASALYRIRASRKSHGLTMQMLNFVQSASSANDDNDEWAEDDESSLAYLQRCLESS